MRSLSGSRGQTTQVLWVVAKGPYPKTYSKVSFKRKSLPLSDYTMNSSLRVPEHLQDALRNPNVEVPGSNPVTFNLFLIREIGVLKCFCLKYTSNSVSSTPNYPFLFSFPRCIPFSLTVFRTSYFPNLSVHFSQHPLYLRPRQKKIVTKFQVGVRGSESII